MAPSRDSRDYDNEHSITVYDFDTAMFYATGISRLKGSDIVYVPFVEMTPEYEKLKKMCEEQKEGIDWYYAQNNKLNDEIERLLKEIKALKESAK